MKTVVFLMYHGRGHIHAVFKPAQILRQQGYRVVIAVYEFFREDVIGQEFEFYGLKTVPFALGFEQWQNTIEKKKHLYWHCLRDRWTNRLYKLRLDELTELVANVSPDYLLVDSWQATDFFVLYPQLRTNGTRCGLIQTMLPTVLSAGVPPLNSEVLPYDPAVVNRERKKFFRNRLLKNFKQSVVYFGKTNERLLNDVVRSASIPRDHWPIRSALFSPSVVNLPELVLAPFEFQFKNVSPGSATHYVGFLPSVNRKEKSDPVFAGRYASILKQMATENLALIYCSFGTVNFEDIGPVTKFLDSLYDVVQTLPRTICVVSCNNESVVNSYRDTPRFQVFRSVPQLKVLRDSSLFICHGGINSIKEAVYSSVPLLVYPLRKDVDHEGNAARVEYHSIGLRGNIRSDDVPTIRQKIETLLDSKVYIENLQRLKIQDEKYNEVNFLKMFHGLMPLR
jgi:zeaxanthin glucosyltransferase